MLALTYYFAERLYFNVFLPDVKITKDQQIGDDSGLYYNIIHKYYNIIQFNDKLEEEVRNTFGN
jgi:hypothetical protein